MLNYIINGTIMNLDKYNLDISENSICFYFTSIGRKGTIKKIIKFQQLSKPHYYNISFGDWIDTDIVDDKNITDNGDSQKILATIAHSVLLFTNENKKARIIAVAHSPSRTRLYRISISNNLYEITKKFHLLGLLNDKWEIFEPGMDYKAFLVSRK